MKGTLVFRVESACVYWKQNYYCSLNILETTTFYGVWIDLSRDQISVSHLSLKACGMYNER